MVPAVLVAVLVAVVLPAVAAPARGASGLRPGADSVVDRTLRDRGISESSGLVVSREHPGVLWTHNDSGNSATLFAVGRDGSTVATIRVDGVSDIDWEALAAVRGPGGRSLLAIGDIGDNTASRNRIEIDLVAEPDPLRSRRVSPVRVLRLRYPGEAADAEALLADPRTGRLYVITKSLLGSTVYQVPDSIWPGPTGGPSVRQGTLQRVGDVGLSLVTDGCVLSDSRVLLRTYSTLAVLAPLPTGSRPADRRLHPLDTVPLPVQGQGEGLAVLDEKARTVLLSSEGTRQPVLRLRLDPPFWRAGVPTATVGGSGDGTATPTPTARTRLPDTTDSDVPDWLLLIGLVATIVIGLGIGVGQARRH